MNAPQPDQHLRAALTLASVPEELGGGETYDEQLAGDLAQLNPAYEGSADKASRSQTQYGNSLPVPPQAAGIFTNAVSYQTIVQIPASEVARDWSVTVQPASVPGRLYPIPGGVTAGLLFCKVTWTQGEATYTKGPFILDSVQPTRIHVCGRRVQVDVCWSSVSGASLQLPPIVVQASVAEGGVADSPLDEYMGRWSIADGVSSGTVAVVAGKLMAYEVNLEVMSSDAQLYLVFLDSAAGLSPGAKAIWWSPPLTAAGGWYSFGEQGDERIPFNTQLSWALSSTAGTYTLPTGTAPSAGVKIKVGF